MLNSKNSPLTVSFNIRIYFTFLIDLFISYFNPLYKEFGLEALLQETRGGRHREYMTYEEEQVFLKRHIEAAQDGEFVTVNQLFEDYQKEIGRTSTRDGFYYLLKRHGWRTVTPRPEHPKKADAQTIETSKNKIYIRDLK